MMEEVSIGPDLDDDSYDSLDEAYAPPSERWAPLGAAAPTPEPCADQEAEGEFPHVSERDKLRLLEEEQEQLNTSLLALTSHFAQVQFRLKQIVDAPTDEKETLLKDLEEFAFKGIPDVQSGCFESHEDDKEMNEEDYNSKISEQRMKQQELIEKLKNQLEDLETYAYETGSHGLPTSRVMEKQEAIIDQLKNKLGIKLDDFDRLNTEDLRKVVDHAIGQIVNPAKVKEKVVEQLKTQIVDLERFIDFLQGEGQGPPGSSSNHACTCPVHGKVAAAGGETGVQNTDSRNAAWKSLHKTLTLLQMFIVTQFGCGSREFQRNVLKKTTKGNHWGDLRARLEVSVEKVMELQAEAEQQQPEDTDYASDSEDAPVIQCNQKLVSAVRKELAACLKDLLQHGLLGPSAGSASYGMVPFGCFPRRRHHLNPKSHKQTDDEDEQDMHAWDLFLKYYDMKHGKEYNEMPVRKLSQAFSLEIVGSKPITAKQTLLGGIEEIVSSHQPLKRSADCQFKAFVCLALNQKKLVSWLHLLLKAAPIIEHYYQPWSYIVKTGFSDALQSLDRLSKLHFDLPVDLAIQPFNNINEAF